MNPSDSTKILAHFVTFDLLDEADCQTWLGRVRQLRSHWRSRHALAPFYTLGLASYMDCDPAKNIYHDPAQRRENNQLLDEHFGPLLQLVSATLSAHFGRPAHLTDEAARPGFHIYLPHFAFGLPVASVHRDLQYRHAFPALIPAEADLFSFTLSLSTPAGSGLNLWPDPAGAPDFFPYSNGQLVVHHGLTTHQAVLKCNGDVDRITLQGHCLMHEGRALLYC
jgi:hypothetical protein